VERRAILWSDRNVTSGSATHRQTLRVMRLLAATCDGVRDERVRPERPRSAPVTTESSMWFGPHDWIAANESPGADHQCSATSTWLPRMDVVAQGVRRFRASPNRAGCRQRCDGLRRRVPRVLRRRQALHLGLPPGWFRSTAACASTSLVTPPLAERITWAVVDRSARRANRRPTTPPDRRLRLTDRLRSGPAGTLDLWRHGPTTRRSSLP
jgi:hypothetical protein